MRTPKLRALLLDALVAGSAATAGCASLSSVPPLSMQPVASPPAPTPNNPVAEPRASGQSNAPAPSAPTAPYPIPAEKTVACAGAFRNVLRDLKPARAFDYVELRQRPVADTSDKEETLLAHGRPCATAVHVDACHKALRETAKSGFGSSCHPGHCDFYLVVTDAGGVKRLVSPAEVAAFTGVVDTPGEALLLAFANNHAVLACDGPIPTKAGNAWELTTNLMIKECPIVTADVTLSIAENGAVTVVRTANRKETNACVGRRPPGLRSAGIHAGSAVASYLEASAHLEAASVPAFERLGRELETLGAPARLTHLCDRAAADERRHTRVMARLGRAYGARAHEIVLDNVPRRDALALAIDNAAEGCVRETFGALVGLYQATHARDRRVRAAMRGIARDEIRHAALAWKIAAWLEPKLAAHDAERVTRARARAIEELKDQLRVEPAPELRTTLGLPSSAAATRMAQALTRALWS